MAFASGLGRSHLGREHLPFVNLTLLSNFQYCCVIKLCRNKLASWCRSSNQHSNGILSDLWILPHPVLSTNWKLNGQSLISDDKRSDGSSIWHRCWLASFNPVAHSPATTPAYSCLSNGNSPLSISTQKSEVRNKIRYYRICEKSKQHFVLVRFCRSCGLALRKIRI